MIEYQQNLDLLRQYEQTDLFSVRVLALAESYGCGYNFARFYVQRTESGQMTAVLSYLDRDCTLSLTENADRERSLYSLCRNSSWQTVFGNIFRLRATNCKL